MCNAWNHSPACNCGWGGSGGGWHGGGGGWANNLSYDLSTSSTSRYRGDSISNQRSARDSSSRVRSNPCRCLSDAFSSSETYPIQCWWCGEWVYYHTNGYGDSVLFDSLGYPWQVHSCWSEYWAGEKPARGEAPSKQRGLPIILGRKLKGDKSLTDDDLKCLVIVGAVLSLWKKESSITELSLATQLGISLDTLRRDFGHLYELYMRERVVYLRLKDSIPLASGLRSKLAW